MENKVANLGKVIGEVAVRIGPQLLTVFSEQLYSSPNKAFEELIANSWDAGANAVHIGFPDHEQEEGLFDASDDVAPRKHAVWVVDDGISMDEEGLKDLWRIAWSGKREKPSVKKRQPIGKFGVGKLATYLLANNIVYICKSADGVIRAVEVDYAELVKTAPNQLTSDRPQPLEIRELTEAELGEILDRFHGGETISALVRHGVPQPTSPESAEEYGGAELPPAVASTTWTIVLLTSLKDAGKAIQEGRLRWILRASLPLSPVMTISMNGELLQSTKIDQPIGKEWEIGTDLEIPSVLAKDGHSYDVQGFESPYKGVALTGTGGPMSGRLKLYLDKLTGGKSDLIGASHGFFVNILGRVINLNEKYFGLENLSHKTWSKMRVTIRADWLDAHLTVTREALTECKEVRAFRALLLALFNKARNADDDAQRASWPKAGDILTQRYGTVPLLPLKRAVAEGLHSEGTLPVYIAMPDEGTIESITAGWNKSVEDNTASVVNNVVIADLSAAGLFALYNVEKREIQVNQNHPFYREHATSHEEQELMRDSGFADVLTLAYMSDLGVSDDDIRHVANYKDEILRLLAKLRRRTAGQLAELLLNATDHPRGMERALDEAFDHLGFVVQPLAQSGEPEGVAVAPLTPDANGRRAYRFTYDAKSTTHPRVSTANLNVAALRRHREKYHTEYAIVVAVDFQEGVYVDECRAAQVTPMRAYDLATLLIGMATRGAMNYRTFEELFKKHDAEDVTKWVTGYIDEVTSQAPLTLAEFLQALAQEEFEGPDLVTSENIAKNVRKARNVFESPTAKDITTLVRGLQTLIPWLIRVEQDGHLVISGTPQAIRNAIVAQTQHFPPKLRVNLDISGG